MRKLSQSNLPKLTGIQSFDPLNVDNQSYFGDLTIGIDLLVTTAPKNKFVGSIIKNSFFASCRTGIEAYSVSSYFDIRYNEFKNCTQEAVVVKGIENGYYAVNNFIENDEIAFRATGSGTGHNVLLGNTFTREKRGLRLEKSNLNFYTYCNSFLGNTRTLTDIDRAGGSSWVNQRGGCPGNNVITYLPSNKFTDWTLASPSFVNVYTDKLVANIVQYYVASQFSNYDPIKTNTLSPPKFFKIYCGSGVEDCNIIDGNAEAIVDKSLEDIIIGYTVYKNQIDSLLALTTPTADDLNELKILLSEIKPYLFFAFNKYLENNQTVEALTLLANDNSFYSKKLLCDYYINNDSLTAASNIVSTLTTINSSEQEIIDFCELYPIIISALQAEDYWQYLHINKVYIQTIADRSQSFYSIQAQGIYNYQSLIYDYENDNDSEFTMYVEPYPMPEPEVINYENEDSTEINSPIVTISISPNPVTETFMASIVNNSNTQTYTIKITDVYGIVKYSNVITIMQNQTQNIPIDFSNEISGVYNAKIELNGCVLNSVLFIKQ